MTLKRKPTSEFTREDWQAAISYLDEKLDMCLQALIDLEKMDPLKGSTVTRDELHFWSTLRDNIVFLLGQVPWHKCPKTTPRKTKK